MKVCTNIKELKDFYPQIQGKTALVPTMGALHDGHLSLVNIASTYAENVFVSIFVNPKQFNNPEDLKRYPRDLERDLRLLAATGASLVFAPELEEIYPNPSSSMVEPCELAKLMEGAFRPGHFSGVCTIVSILFNLLQPDYAVFGEKDFQQLRIIQELSKDLHFPVQIIPAPIQREDNGLARSSRNELLSSEARARAQIISESLNIAKNLAQTGETSSQKILNACLENFTKVPDLQIEYLTINNQESLLEVETLLEPKKYRIFFAGYLDGVRLIDNLSL